MMQIKANPLGGDLLTESGTPNRFLISAGDTPCPDPDVFHFCELG